MYCLYLESKNKMIEMNLFKKQKQTWTQKTNLGLPKGKGGRDKLGVRGKQI